MLLRRLMTNIFYPSELMRTFSFNSWRLFSKLKNFNRICLYVGPFFDNSVCYIGGCIPGPAVKTSWCLYAQQEKWCCAHGHAHTWFKLVAVADSIASFWWGSLLLRVELCYTPKFTHWSPNPQSLRMWLHLKNKALKRMIKLKWGN